MFPDFEFLTSLGTSILSSIVYLDKYNHALVESLTYQEGEDIATGIKPKEVLGHHTVI